MSGSSSGPLGLLLCRSSIAGPLIRRLSSLRSCPRFVCLKFLAVAILLVLTAHSSYAQASSTGQWQTLPTQTTINPVHVALMHNGKVLVVSGSGNLPSDTSYMAEVWDPATDTFTTQPVGWDMFCNGMIVLPDGRPFVLGGTIQYDPFSDNLGLPPTTLQQAISWISSLWLMVVGTPQPPLSATGLS